ncbi:hypothetical protein CYLTODRAFT_486227 [Cylindrobasidium torrendii FP15055 ss-10]|uniref:Uncharacterized protein n=1 Tax=Cylindrobasidium torrendii FP15055 ss-10 TaxID=1314674 RepID=A0A0D7BSJ2_9AGAR|nr:hypothetical protein CYLTODRAFT_486227 [Cylindrobasidium torrendii FP15055 ss-10]
MPAAVPLDCFSLSKSFESPIVSFPFVVGDQSEDQKLDALEFYHGFKRGEVIDQLYASQNTVTCREDFAELLRVQIYEANIFLYPSKRTVYTIHKQAHNNTFLPIENRTRPEQDFPSPIHEYDFLFPRFRQPIYVRDPTSLEVVCHEAPYSNLPRAQTTLNPCFWAIKVANTGILVHGATLALNLIQPIYDLSRLYRFRIPLKFFYFGGRALGDFPSRKLPYTPRELGVPNLVTARKRGHDEIDSDDDDVRTTVNSACDLSAIEAWCNSASSGTKSQSAAIIGEVHPNSEDKESVQSVAEMEGWGDQWLQVLKRRSEDTGDKSVRKYLAGLVRAVQREHSRRLADMRLPKVATSSQPVRKVRRAR